MSFYFIQIYKNVQTKIGDNPQTITNPLLILQTVNQ
tara:strand:- start:1297 stop:1404 length:108 start_codon:yes stop_codon:yes gene_type:complete